MSYNTKLALMFGPFVLFFAGLAVMVHDLRHPVASNDQCVVTGTGSDAQPYKGRGIFIYRQSNNVQHDISLRCNRLGTVLLNDLQLFINPVKSGEGAWVSRKQYHFLPDRWSVSVYTGPTSTH